MSVSRIHEAFDVRTRSGGKLFLPCLCAGDPDYETSRRLLAGAAESGADLLEVSIPYSDPLADGPTMQKASVRSLEDGMRLGRVFELVEDFRDHYEIPLVLMTYYNPVFRLGERRFLDRAAEAGADGVLVVDLPPEEGGDFFDRATKRDLGTVLLATPTTPLSRLRDLGRLATGFLYYVTVTGVTGVRSGYSSDLLRQLEQAREVSEVPNVMGFGVSDYDSVKPYLDAVDGVVSASHLVDGLEAALPDADEAVHEVSRRVRQLSEPLHNHGTVGSPTGG